ncbi:MAG: peptidyl-prolyl cis-trans isomerase [Deltaproteobacteria bacterium]|nr:peptidyl-prolyl cis-trans isomerase [Deltaproteobacteria bacterium]
MKICFTKAIFVLSVFMFLMCGCNDDKDVKATVDKETGKKPDENVLAVVGDEEIRTEEVKTILDWMQVPERRRRAGFHQKVLDDLVEARVFANAAREEGFLGGEEVKKELDKIRIETLTRYFLTTELPKEAKPSQEAVKEYYEQHQEQYRVSDGVLLKHIVTKEKEEAEAVLEALKKGASFEDVAKEKSIGRTWDKGGRLGWVFRGKIPPELEKIAFGLELGKLSDVVKTKGGYEVIKVLERKDAHTIPLEEASADIRTKLLWRNRQKLQKRYYEAAGVDRNPEEEGVLVKIGDKVIKEEAISSILAKAPKKERAKLREKWADYFVQTTVFHKLAEKRGLDKRPAVVYVLRHREDRYLAKRFRNQMGSQFEITDGQLRDYYDSHEKEFARSARARIKSILVKTLKEAEEVKKRLREGADFNELAKRKSLVHAASRKDENIPWLEKAKMGPVLGEAVLSLDEGQISDIIETKGGYHIIRLLEKQSGPKPLDDVKQSIKMKLVTEQYHKEKKNYYEKVGVEVFSPMAPTAEDE